MHYNNTTEKLSQPKIGFTIVELIVVIAVIGILATISIVSYANWKQQTTIAQLKSDLNGVVSAMESARTFGNTYPTTIPTSFTPSSGVTLSGGGLAAGKSFCISAANSGLSYYVTDSSKPALGSCDSASCLAIFTAGQSTGDGTYWIKPAGTAFQVRCDMTTDGGGWTLVGKGREGWNWTNAGQGTLSDIATNPTGNVVSFMPSATITSIINKNVNSLTDGVRLYRFGTNQDWRMNFSTMTTWDWNMDTSFAVNVTGRSPVCTGTLVGNSTDGNYCAAANDCDRIFTWAWAGHDNIRGWSSGQSCSCADYGLYGWCYAGEGHVILMSQVWVRR